MNDSRRRVGVFFALLLLTMINYVDRINLSVAATPLGAAFHLSPVAMGYLFSSFLWTYVLFLIPAGLAIDRWGTRVVTAVCVGVWSVAAMLTGAAGTFTTLIATRLGLGAGEAATYPAGGRVVREWAPRSERGLATAILNAGAFAGPALGAAFVGWLVSAVGWRGSFVVTGAIGLVWMLGWLAWYRVPEGARWLGAVERAKILAERDAGPTLDAAPIAPRTALAALLRSRTMWALMLTQGCANYTQYLFLTWLPSYLQAAHGLDVLRTGLFTAVPYAVTFVMLLVLGNVSDRVLTSAAIAQGKRRNLVASALVVSSVILIAPLTHATWLILALISISLTCMATAVTMNVTLTIDLLRDARSAGLAVSLLILGGNVFGIFAPIVTGYVVASGLGYAGAFVIAGVLLLAGALVCRTLTTRAIGVPAAPPLAAPLTPSISELV